MPPKNQKNKFCLNVGIGDVIICKSQMLQAGITKVFVSPNICLTKQVRSPEHYKFILNLIKTVYYEPRFEVTENQDKEYKRINWTYFNSMKFRPKRLNLCKQLCIGKPLKCEKPYVVVNMKVRGLTQSKFKAFLPILKTSLKSLQKKYKIVFIGERKVGMNPEYAAHAKMGCKPFSLYEHIKGLMDLDLTVPELGITAPDINDLKQKCVYFRDAKAVINLGHGGNTTLSASVSKETINYFGNKEIVGSMFYLNSHKNHKALQTPDAFKERIRSILK